MPDRPARTQSLYRLSYPVQIIYMYIYICTAKVQANAPMCNKLAYVLFRSYFFIKIVENSPPFMGKET